MKFLLVLVVVLSSVSVSCDSLTGPEEHEIEVVIPADTRTIDKGVLRMSFYSYDPRIADKPADQLGRSENSFSHMKGTLFRTTMTISGKVPKGHNKYVVVQGFEILNGEETYILWGGRGANGVPRRIVMELND